MRGALLAIFCFLALTPACARAQGGGVQVAPVIVDLSERGLASLRVRNGRAREAAFEVDVYAWSQVNGESVLSPTDALIVSPGVFAIGAAQEQIVRLAQAPRARGAGYEQTYRIVLRELPRGPAPAGGSRLLLELSLPVFATPEGLAPSLHLRRIHTEDGRTAVLLTNAGGAHARLAGATRLPNATAIGGVPRYLLAGADVVLPLESETAQVRLRWAGGDAPFPTDETFTLGAAPALADLR